MLIGKKQNMILNRDQFRDYWNNVDPRLGRDNSPLWEAESGLTEQCQYFVYVDSVIWDSKDNYWNWVNTSCRGSVRCFCSSQNDFERGKEWWGFTHRDDIVFWTLRWVDN